MVGEGCVGNIDMSDLEKWRPGHELLIHLFHQKLCFILCRKPHRESQDFFKLESPFVVNQDRMK